jgi:RNA polymerase sigma factor (sigma-70 family)
MAIETSGSGPATSDAAIGGATSAMERLGRVATLSREPLLRLACRITRDALDLDDLLQEALVRALGRAGELAPAEAGEADRVAAAFLAGFVRNVALEERRRRRGVSLTAFEGDDGELLLPIDEPGPAAAASSSEGVRRAVAAIDELPASRREVMRLLTLERLTVAEAAERLGKAVATVYELRSSARVALGRALLSRPPRAERRPAPRVAEPLRTGPEFSDARVN